MRDFSMDFTGCWTRLCTRAGLQILAGQFWKDIGPGFPVFDAAFHIRHLLRVVAHEPKVSSLYPDVGLRTVPRMVIASVCHWIDEILGGLVFCDFAP